MRPSLAIAALSALAFCASARAQVRVEAVVPRIAPAGVAAVPRGYSSLSLGALAAPPLSASFSVAPSPYAAAAPISAAGAPAALLPAAAASVPDAALPPSAAERPAAESPVTASAVEHPVDRNVGRWSLPKSEEGAAWRFRDLPFLSARLWDGSRAAPEAGAGAMGSVFVHPSRPDSVVKVARRGYADASGDFMSSDEDALDFEDRDLARLAALGASPRPLARLTISGRPASERERVYGSTVARLKKLRAFGPREHWLVHQLLGRIAEGGYVARDLNLGNIMIGRRGGDPLERAWLVDTLGVSSRPELDAQGRKALMLAEPVPWLAIQGLGLARPLGRMLDDALRPDRPLIPQDAKPLPWSKPRRYATLAAVLGALAFLPSLSHALAAPSALGILPSWTALAGAGVFLALAGIPLRIFAHRLAPWIMTRSKDRGVEILRTPPAMAVPELGIGALIEEIAFRGIAFIGGALLLMPFLPYAAAIAVASIASSLVFALIHGYGSVWTRVVGGMIYAGALVATGSLVLPIAAHFAFNLSLYVYGRYLRP